MTFSFHPEAKDEFNESIEYYEDCEPGLGYDFSIEVYRTIQNVIKYPTAWKIIEDEVRGCLVNRFPYSILYSIEQDRIFILAVMHQRKHPDYWKNRH